MARSGFSLMEVLVVIIIISIAAAISIGNHFRVMEQALDKEAKVNLTMVQSAEKTYHMEYTVYYPQTGSTTDIDAVNENLKVYLPRESSRKWNYTVNSDGSVTAVRNVSDGRSWSLGVLDEEPACTGKYCP